MRKFLSIIIPRYLETEMDIFPLLSSINIQVGIDFNDIEVIIVNDGGSNGSLDDTFLSLFSMDIRQVSLEKNGGPGVARQAGLETAKGTYVMFCDADDSLHSVGVLGALLKEVENTDADMLTSSWLEELQIEDGQYIYITHEQENTWMHGKVFKRVFLVNNGIKFHPELRVHEDSYFLSIAAAATKNIRYMPITSYIWKFRPNSITRVDNGIYTYKSIPTFIKANTLAFKEIEKIAPEQMQYKVVQFTLYNYFSFQSPGWQDPKNAEYLKAAEKTFAEYMVPFWHYWEDAPKEYIAQVYNQERNRTFKFGIEPETLDSWLNRIKGDE